MKMILNPGKDYFMFWIGFSGKTASFRELDFSLAYINFDDRETLGNGMAPCRPPGCWSNSRTSLDSHLRKTDIVARNGTDFWVFFPTSKRSRCAQGRQNY